MSYLDPAAESLLAFWRDAGVADAFEATPQNRLTESERHARARPPAAGAPPPSPLAPELAEATAAAREAALAAGSLQTLGEAVAAFTGSALRGAGRGVFVRGASKPEVVVIGEAPGPDDDGRGVPFAGPSGRLLDKALAAAGLAERSLITNTVFWRPPGDRGASREEQAVCAPFLDRLISLVRPKVLLLLGAGSTKSVLKEDGGILGLRGRWFEHVSDDGALKTAAMPTLHPAFLLRQPQAKKMFWNDLLSLAAELDRLDSTP